jgi:two-component system nitrogen regulation response regulator GlnG/two-component system response regulator HydG
VADTTEEVSRAKPDPSEEHALALAILWSREAGRAGEVMFVERPATLGRGEGDDETTKRLVPVRQRPASSEPRPPLGSTTLSRDQLAIEPVAPGRLLVTNRGRRRLFDARGLEHAALTVDVGDVFEIEDELVLMVVRRPRRWPKPTPGADYAWPPFGAPDAFGIVGESPEAWNLRSAIAFLAARSAHVLVLGPSGAGKELVAQAIHGLSVRGKKRLVARNAATFAETLVDAELFGTAADFPNQGMPERPGLVGEAEGSTLFFDEIGDLPEAMQTRLLRLLDPGADYQRLGDPRRRTAQFRFIGATNQPLDRLRPDVAARFKLQLTVPGLEARREDVPLVARALLARIAREDPALGARFGAEPQVTPALVRALVTRPWVTHVRELEAMLWRAIGAATGDVLDVDPTVPIGEAPRRVEELTREDVVAALARAGGVRERAWRELGLKNRHVLKRLLKKWDLGEDDE